ncbi:putative reverse transcriptase domain-containing protein [Tanacetum coccineum]
MIQFAAEVIKTYFIAIGSAEDERHIKEMNEESKDPKKKRFKKRVVNETPREKDTTKVPAEQEVTEQGTKKRKSGNAKMIDSEIMETKSFVSKFHKVSSPDGDYLVVYRFNGHFWAFNYLMEGDLKIMMESSTEENDQAGGGVESRVRESDGGDRIDREMGRIFGVGRKSSSENFSGGCGGGRRLPDIWEGEERVMRECVGLLAAMTARDATRNGNDSHTSGTGARRPVQVARECTYPDFLKCQPLNFKGTKGVVGLTQWFEKMESVYSISNYTVACQVKFATCTLQGNALTWWNSHVKTTTLEAAHAMSWRTLKKMMTNKYYPRGEIKKLEFEMWNLKVKGNDVVTYSQRFQELALIVMATKPKTMQDAIEFATELMDKKINTWAERQADNKRKSDDTARNNQNQQPNKRQNTGRAYAAGNGDRRPYEGPRPLCSKCNYHHDGSYAPKCHKCNRFGHLSRDCSNPTNVNTGANQRGNVCFESGA